MTFRDLIEVSFRNLWRTKLRAALTIAGVTIAIATFVAMLSFAAGNHRYFSNAYNEFGLMNQMSVTPEASSAADTAGAAILNNEAIGRISLIPGVRLAYPYSVFDVKAAVLDTVLTAKARVLPPGAVQTKLFSKILGGARFSSGSAKEALVTQSFVNALGVEPDSLLGRTLVLSVKVATLDSAMAASMDHPNVEVNDLLRRVDRDSLYDVGYRRRFIRNELGERIGRFVKGLMERKATVSDTLTIVAIAPDDPSHHMRTSPIIIPDETARRLSRGGVLSSGDPTDLLVALKDGGLFEPDGAYDKRGYPRVTLELDPLASHKAVKDSVQSLGYRAFSFAEQFEEMQRFMVYYYLGLSVIGVIALVTASLGIINTLVMSITERRREIGILKSLGGQESDIRKLYLVESGVIGAVGSAAGIIIGWAGTKVVAAIISRLMEREEMPVFDPFHLPLWLIALAFSFGLLVSLAAGLYPAARAARVDPVEALRSE
jgi:ABC-type antimicrobial peptide transport system permease subunit